MLLDEVVVVKVVTRGVAQKFTSEVIFSLAVHSKILDYRSSSSYSSSIRCSAVGASSSNTSVELCVF